MILDCRRSLELILDAEPTELSLDGDSPLVAHLKSCDRCRRVANRLAEQTVMVAAEVKAEPAILELPARPEPVKPAVWPMYAGLAAAAALTLMVVTADHGSQIEDRSLGQGNRVVDTPQAPAVAQVPARRPAAPKAEPRSEQIRAIAVAPVRFERQTVEESVRLIREKRNADTSGVISVAPPAGVRATVLATSNPAVTVIWLQAADTSRNPR
jgi:hypothetical protein